MARTDKAITVVVNGAAVQASYTNVDVTNGIRVTGVGKYSDVQVVVRNTAGTPKNVILRKGVHGRASVGDGTYAVPATTGEVQIYPESMRFEQADESLWVDFEAGFTGTIGVFAMPLPS